MTILQDLSQLSREQLEAMVRAMNGKPQGKGIVVNALGTVSPHTGKPYKGTVSVYVGRNPVTLYPAQWRKLLAKAADIETVIEANKDRLSWKEGD